MLDRLLCGVTAFWAAMTGTYTADGILFTVPGVPEIGVLKLESKE